MVVAVLHTRVKQFLASIPPHGFGFLKQSQTQRDLFQRFLNLDFPTRYYGIANFYVESAWGKLRVREHLGLVFRQAVFLDSREMPY